MGLNIKTPHSSEECGVLCAGEVAGPWADRPWNQKGPRAVYRVCRPRSGVAVSSMAAVRDAVRAGLSENSGPGSSSSIPPLFGGARPAINGRQTWGACSFLSKQSQMQASGNPKQPETGFLVMQGDERGRRWHCERAETRSDQKPDFSLVQSDQRGRARHAQRSETRFLGESNARTASLTVGGYRGTLRVQSGSSLQHERCTCASERRLLHACSCDHFSATPRGF